MPEELATKILMAVIIGFVGNAILSVGAVLGSWRLMVWRIVRLEKSVENHDKWGTRIARVETRLEERG